MVHVKLLLSSRHLRHRESKRRALASVGERDHVDPFRMASASGFAVTLKQTRLIAAMSSNETHPLSNV